MPTILTEPPRSELEAAERNAEAIRHWYRAQGRDVTVVVERVSVPRNNGIATTYSAVIKTPIGCGGKA